MTYKEFVNEVEADALNRPSYIRKGQAVFNYVNHKYGVARAVQFKDGVDCFYDNKKIEAFLECAYKRIINDNERN